MAQFRVLSSYAVLTCAGRWLVGFVSLMGLLFCTTCASSTSMKTQCNDGKDNDGDGLYDYPEDPDCFSPQDNNEETQIPKGCGNGRVDEGEACDDGNNEDGDLCRSDCLQDMTKCGNGQIDSGEACDDGNTVDGDTCRDDCGQSYLLCGNGELDQGEFCDDGNTQDGDVCSSDCKQDLTLCGNGRLDPGETCDDGLPPGVSVCSEDCTLCNGPCTDASDCIKCHDCDASGHCTLAEAGSDPRDDCEDESAESCGLNGTCDGAGECAVYDSNTVCEEGRCEGSVLHMTRYCDGFGACGEAETIDCAPDECTLPDAPEAGTVCGTGEPVVLTHDDMLPDEHTFAGNLLHSGGANWYRVGAVATDGALAIYVWFDENPGEEFAFQVRLGTGNVDDCSDGELECSMDAPYTRYSFVFDQCDTSCDELGRNVYIGVQRKVDTEPTCSDYALKVRVGGETPLW